MEDRGRLLLHRYRIRRLLGRGGSGTVFEVEDTLFAGRIVAAKVLNNPTPSTIERLRSEFRTLARLNHPNLVRVHELHVAPSFDPGLMTMEMVDGVPLLDAAKNLDVPGILALLGQLCAALSYLHRHGIAHRDIKSDNVLLDNSPTKTRAVLTDLSLSGPDGLVLAGQYGGTPQYLPPEVFCGQPTDRRGDLYSLGVLAYRLLSGRYPYNAAPHWPIAKTETLGERSSMHETAPHLSPELCAAVERLLHRDPDRRHQTAAAFWEAIRHHTTDHEESPLENLPTAPNWPFVGRQTELKKLQRTIDLLGPLNQHLEQVPRRVHLVLGEPGIGKSRVVEQLRINSQLLGLPFVIGSCQGRDGRPFLALRDALQQLLPWIRTHDATNNRSLATTHKTLLASLLQDTRTEQHRESTYMEERPTWIQDEVARLLTTFSADVPFTLVFENIDNADPATLRCLSALISQTTPARYLLVLTLRPTTSPSSQLSDLLRSCEENDVPAHSMEPFDRDAVAELVTALSLSPSDSSATVDGLLRVTGGRPAFLDVVLQELTRRQFLNWTATGTDIDVEALEQMPIPESIQTWIGEWLQECSAEELLVLDALAIFDRPSLREAIARVADLRDARDPVRTLTNKGILSQTASTSRGTITFAHGRSREIVYDRIDADRRRTMHSRAAEFLLSGSPTGTQLQASDISLHLLEAGDPHEAARWALRAANDAYKTFALDVAEKFYRISIDHLQLNDRRERLEALEGLAEVLNLGLRHDEAGEVLRTLVKQATEDHTQDFLARGLAGLTEVHLGASQYAEAEELSARALRIARDIGDPHSEARALKAVADTYHYQSKLEEARCAYAELVALREGLGDSLGCARGWHNLGWVCNSMRKFREAAGHFAKAETIYRQLGNVPRLAHTLSALGANELDAGQFSVAVDKLDDALSQARASRSRRTEALCLANLGQARNRLGCYSLALANLDEARHIFFGLKGFRYLAPVELTIGWVFTDVGAYHQAEKRITAAREAYLSLEDQPGLSLCLAAQGDIHRLVGDSTTARFWCERALEIARGAKDAQFTAICLTSLALASFEEGENLNAVDYLIEARSLAREVGAEDTEHLACLALARVLIFGNRLPAVAGLLDRLMERAEKMRLTADIPQVLLLRGLFKARLGDTQEATRLFEEGMSRAESSSPAESRWELRQCRLHLHRKDGNDSAADRLTRETDALIQSAASSIAEEERRTAFVRRTRRGEETLRDLFDLPPSAEHETEALGHDLLHIGPQEVSDGPAHQPPAESPPVALESALPAANGTMDQAAGPADEALSPLCDGPEERQKLRAVLHLLVDRAVFATRSTRGGLFLATPLVRHNNARGEDVLRLIPVALRDLQRESLGDASQMSFSILEAAVKGEQDVIAADLLTESEWARKLTIRSRNIPAVMASCVFIGPEGSEERGPAGVLYLDRTDVERPFQEADKQLAAQLSRDLGRILTSLVESRQTWENLQALEEAVHRLDREALPMDGSASDNTESASMGSVVLIGKGPAMQSVFDLTRRLSSSATPVLISGETGTGKELIARSLHEAGSWRDGPFVALDCGALSESMAEAELFGHARGAFSGAEKHRSGLIRSAQNGTFFLDEIGNLPASLQLKLLRVLETSEVRPVGADQPTTVTFRLVAATNADLPAEIRQGRFRQDLFHRLQGGLLELPPLRDHREDLEPLVQHLLTELCKNMDRKVPRLTPGTWERLYRHEWPGNVRELRLSLQAMLAVNTGDTLEADDLPNQFKTSRSIGSGGRGAPVTTPRGPQIAGFHVPDALEGRMILKALVRNNWEKTAAARQIGWSRQKLYRAMGRYAIPTRVSSSELAEIQDRLDALLAADNPSGAART